MQEHVVDELLLGDAAQLGVLRDLLLEQRRPSVARPMAFMVMPCSATSSATVLVRPAMPCLAATYALLKGEATSACAEAMLMMRPQRFAFMPGTARRIVWNDAVRSGR